MSTNGKVRFAIVGAGIIGNRHVQVMADLSDQVQLVAVIDTEKAKAEKAVPPSTRPWPTPSATRTLTPWPSAPRPESMAK
jgi:ornithine cyclodeaminase/alanine dehydrogenase-like protein (mu-crystallin family)